MKRASLVLALVAAVLLAVLVRAQMSPDPAVQGPSAEAPPASGMALIDGYGCRSGEVRKTIIRGVEDKFASSGHEPARMHPRLRGLLTRYDEDRAGYDSRVPDHQLSDWFELPRTTVSAMLVLRIRPIGDNLNDTMAVGDMSDWRHWAATRPAEPDPRKGWKRSGDLIWVDLGDLHTESGPTVLDRVRADDASGIVDLQVVDDTAVDFAAVVYCQAAGRRMGVTLVPIPIPKGRVPGVAAFDCRTESQASRNCNPAVGDEPCGNLLPLLCFHDLQMPAPGEAVRYSALTRRSWSGGEVAATVPLRASQFRTISDADRFCRATFGKGWRVAEWHAGGWGYGFAAESKGMTFSGRYWIDIRGSPYGTCWSRDHDR